MTTFIHQETVDRLRHDLDPQPTLPDYPVGTVIRFAMKYERPGRTYLYAAIYARSGHWYTTATTSPFSANRVAPMMSTADLMRVLREGDAFDIEVARAWTEVAR